VRWKIENEGFNVQKKGGYELEHAYTNHPNSAKVFYFLLQIAHLLAQLLYKTTLLKANFTDGFGSAKTWPSDYWKLGEMPVCLKLTSLKRFKNDSKSALILLDPLDAPVLPSLTTYPPVPAPIHGAPTSCSLYLPLSIHTTSNQDTPPPYSF